MAFDVGVGVGVEARRQMKSERQCEFPSSACWCNLPDDIICLILNHLYYVDQIRFRAVCKSWRTANIQGTVKSADKLPWMMGFNSDACYLYDPIHRKIYSIEPSITKSGIFVNASVLASKYGWVLFAKFKNGDRSSRQTQFFFYTPFTNQFIELPDLSTMRDDQVTFTTSPESPDCEIFLVRARSGKISILKCKPGDTIWAEVITNMFIGDYQVPGKDIEFVDGILYTSFRQRAVIAFNAALKQLKIFPYPPGDSIESDGNLWNNHYLIEFDGNLLLCYGMFYSPHDTGSHRYRVFRLDISHMNWIRVHDLDNKALFLEDNTSLLVPVHEKQSKLANSIHSRMCRLHGHCEEISQIYHWKVTVSAEFWINLPQLK